MYRYLTFGGVPLPEYSFTSPLSTAAPHRPTFVDAGLKTVDSKLHLWDILTFVPEPYKDYPKHRSTTMQSQTLRFVGSLLNNTAAETKNQYDALKDMVNKTAELVRQDESYQYPETGGDNLDNQYTYLTTAGAPAAGELKINGGVLRIDAGQSVGVNHAEALAFGKLISIEDDSFPGNSRTYRFTSTPQFDVSGYWYNDVELVSSSGVLTSNTLSNVLTFDDPSPPEASKQSVRARLARIEGDWEPFNNRLLQNFGMVFDVLDPTWSGPFKTINLNVPTPDTTFTLVNDGDAWLHDVFFSFDGATFGSGRDLQIANQVPDPLGIWHDWIATNNDDGSLGPGNRYVFSTKNRLWREVGISADDLGFAVDTTLFFTDNHNTNHLISVPPKSIFNFSISMSGNWVLPVDVTITYSDAWL